MSHPYSYFFSIIVSAIILSGCATIPTNLDSVINAPMLADARLYSINHARTPRLSPLSSGLVLSWLDNSKPITKLKFSLFKNNQWGKAQTAQAGNNWFINYADYAKVTALNDTHFIASWLEFSDNNRYDYLFKVSQSFDAGVSWSKPSSPIINDQGSQHGFVSVIKANNLPTFVWISSLGKRYALQSATLNQQNQWSPISTIDDDTCSCCHTDIALHNQQAVVAYRNRTADEIRDIAITQKTDQQWTKPSIVHADNWAINGCPVNGPAISANAKGYSILWFTAANDTPSVKLQRVFNDQSLSTLQVLGHQEAIGYVDSTRLQNNQTLMMWLSYSDHLKMNFYQTKDVSQPNKVKATLKPDFVIHLEQKHVGFPSIVSYLDTIYITYANTKGDVVLLNFNQNQLLSQ